MKYLFIHLEVQDGERRHDHRVLHTTNAKNIEFAAQRYVASFWGNGYRDDRNSEWWNVNAGEIALRLRNVTELTEAEYKFMHDIFTGFNRSGYFKIEHQGWREASQREEIEINAGENGKIMIYQDADKLGFIVDVYGQNDEVGTMTIWEEDLYTPDEEVEKDDDGNCVYCGQKCWDGQMCDEQQAGGFNK